MLGIDASVRYADVPLQGLERCEHCSRRAQESLFRSAHQIRQVHVFAVVAMDLSGEGENALDEC